jgi:DNA-binding transcriptional LysR family regulator
VEPFVERKQLRVVLEDFEMPPRPISIVYPHARLLPARTRAFIEFARQELTRFRRG